MDHNTSEVKADAEFIVSGLRRQGWAVDLSEWAAGSIWQLEIRARYGSDYRFDYALRYDYGTRQGSTRVSITEPGKTTELNTEGLDRWLRHYVPGWPEQSPVFREEPTNLEFNPGESSPFGYINDPTHPERGISFAPGAFPMPIRGGGEDSE
jgi:hypothetical protein